MRLTSENSTKMSGSTKLQVSDGVGSTSECGGREAIRMLAVLQRKTPFRSGVEGEEGELLKQQV